MTMARQQLGIRGEDLASAALEDRGYAILHRRYRTRYGELDIVALDGGVLVFVEVRARGSGRFGNPAESVTAQKQRRVAPPGPSRPVRGGQQRIDLGLGQPGHQPSLKALRRYCENASSANAATYTMRSTAG